jgi:hypothetical protein
VLYELFTREELYEGLTVVQIRFLVRTQDLRPAFKTPLPSELQKLIERCWDYDPGVRPTMSDVLDKLTLFQNDKFSLGAFSEYVSLSKNENATILSSDGTINTNANNNNNDNNNNNNNNQTQYPNKSADRFHATFSTPRKNSKTNAVAINSASKPGAQGSPMSTSAPGDRSRVFSSV